MKSRTNYLSNAEKRKRHADKTRARLRTAKCEECGGTIWQKSGSLCKKCSGRLASSNRTTCPVCGAMLLNRKKAEIIQPRCCGFCGEKYANRISGGDGDQRRDSATRPTDDHELVYSPAHGGFV